MKIMTSACNGSSYFLRLYSYIFKIELINFEISFKITFKSTDKNRNIGSTINQFARKMFDCILEITFKFHINYD